ncbi:PAS domain-containing protein [Sphingomonas sp. MMS24-J13]|uniref:PAS domain-containing protein n=1 Tax=Sphingomonas sp. MMS24-J13 TaxID=3238686 RepID=UPI00385182BA
MSSDASAGLGTIFPGDSEMSRLMRAHDWAATPLGDPSTWPEGLKVPLGMMLSSRFEMWLGWGDDLLFFYNDAYVPTLGIKHPSMMGRPFREVWSEVYHEVEDQVALVRAGEATWNKALPLLLERSGFPEETYHTFSYSPLRGAGGAVEGLMCVVTEETERVISERRLATLGALGHALLGTIERDAIRQACCEVLNANRRDFPFSLLYFQENADQWSGSTASEDTAALIGHEWPFERIDIGGGSIRVPIDPALAPPTGDWDRPATQALIVPIAHAAGDLPFGALVLGLNPYRPHDSEIEGFAQLIAGQVSGALTNISALDRARRRAEQTWTNSRDLIVVVGADGIFRSVSPSWTRILGHPVDEVIGHGFAEFLHPDDLQETIAALGNAAAGSDLTSFDNRFFSRDGELRWISWNTTLEDGLVYGYGRDVSEEKRNSAALAAAEDALRQAQKMEAVGQLTGGIAHDFNNLLTGIIGSLEMMQRKAAQGRTADVERYAAAATSSANRAAALTQRLLAFARRQSLDPKPVDANDLVRGMEELLRRSIGETIELEMVASAGLWRTRCDPNQLENAILNLAINARDAMPDGGRITIETGNASIDASYSARNQFAAPGQYVVVSVTDTGTGMTPDVIAKAFDPFFTTKPIGQGTGLGLSMIYGFARQSEGFVNIYSEVGLGSTVRVYLPRFYGEAGAEEAAPQEADLHRTDDGEIVLVVEDEAAVRGLVVDVLEELGYHAIEAVDGPSGLDQLRALPRIDLLVTDVGLPGLNGRQLADAGRAFRPDLKVLFLTGYAHNAAVGNGLLEPGMDIITKPFAIEKLANRIRSIIER